jgi:competence protein ComEC
MPLLLFSAAFLLGILTADWQPLAVWFWLALGGLGLLTAFLESRLRHAPAFYSRWRGMARLPAGLLLLAFAVGGLRHTLAHPAFTPADLAWYNGQGKAQITGMVSAPPERGAESITLRVEANSLTSLSADGTPGETLAVSGLLITYLPPGGDWRYGDLLQLTGEPAAPESANSGYSAYLANQGIYTTLNQPRAVRLERDTGSPLLAALYSLRDTAYSRINQFLPQPESSLLAGILLGVEENIPQTVADAFRDTGTAHIIAISGFNIAILVGMFFWLFRRLLRWTWAIPATFLTIAAYSLLVGGGASVLRAAVMGGMGLLGREIGRKQSGANSLSFTAAVMLLFNPHLVWDISFQLSFAATLGLILYADPMQQAFIRLTEKRLSPGLARRLAEPVGEYFLFTLAAQVMTLPIILAHFGRLSLSALIANPIILPVQALIMILGGAAVLVGLVLAPLGQLLAWLVYPLLAFTIRAVELLARIPGGVLITGELGAAAILFYYTLVQRTVPQGLQTLAGDRLAGNYRRPALAGLFLPAGWSTAPDPAGCGRRSGLSGAKSCRELCPAQRRQERR